jgi:hypothetical protein
LTNDANSIEKALFWLPNASERYFGVYKMDLESGKEGILTRSKTDDSVV